MNERQKRLNQVFDYLRLNGKMKTQKDFAEAIGVQRTGISAALNGNDLYLTDSLFLKIYAAFPDMFNRDWLVRGYGSMVPEVTKRATESETSIIDLYAQLIRRVDDLRTELTIELEAVHQEREQLAQLIQQFNAVLTHQSASYKQKEPDHLMAAEPSNNPNESKQIAQMNRSDN